MKHAAANMISFDSIKKHIHGIKLKIKNVCVTPKNMGGLVNPTNKGYTDLEVSILLSSV